MPNPPARVVFVDVFIDRVSPLEFRVLPSPKNKPPLPTNTTNHEPGLPEIIFRNDGHAGFIVHFELQGDTHGYFFPPVEADAVWSQRGAACPNDTGIWDVFNPLQVVASGNPPERRTLIVRNRNPRMEGGKGQGKFRYNLRVTNGSRTLDLDPPGDNTNGYGFYDVKSATATTLTVGAAAATATFLLLERGTGLVQGPEKVGIALLIALTLGFGIAALLFRLLSRR